MANIKCSFSEVLWSPLYGASRSSRKGVAINHKRAYHKNSSRLMAADVIAPATYNWCTCELRDMVIILN